MKKVSDYLREEREKQKLSLEEVEKATKIRKSFLVAIEDGRLHALPSESYALGFVKNYASFLGMSVQKAAAFFRREYQDKKLEIVPEFRKSQHKFNRHILSVRAIFIASLFFVIGVYMFFQYRSFLFGPALSVTSPKNGETITKSVIEVKGKTDRYATVLVDEGEAYVGLDGSFKKSIYSYSGEKKITVIAKNRFGKETKEVVTVKVK